MRRLAILAAVVLSACQFDASVPSETKVRCTSDEHCPAGRFCRLEIGLCVFERDDAEAPQFAGDPKVTPGWAKEGATLTLEFQVTEELVRAPVARLSSALGQRALPLDEQASRPEERWWVFSTQIERADGEGPANLLVDMEDLAGNAVTGLLSGVTQLDFTPPSIPPAQVSVQPKIVRPGTAVTVLALASERLAPGARLLARAGTTQLETPPVLADGASLTFTLSTASLATAATALLEIAGLEDLAGNQASPASIGTIEVDGDAPVLSPLTVATPWVSRAPGRDVLRFSFSVAGADRVAAIVGTEDAVCRADGGFHDCELRPGPGQPEGATGVVVRAEDLAGNLAEARGAAAFDFTSPALVPGASGLQLFPPADNPLLRPLHAGARAALQLSFTLTEPTLLPQVSGGGLGWTLRQNQGSSYLYEATVPDAGAVEGAVVPVADVEDLAGNLATLPIALPGAGLVVDVTPPPPPSVAGEVVLRRFPFGAEETEGALRTLLGAAPGALEPGALVRLFAFGNPLAGELVRIPVDADGGFAEVSVADVDLPEPWLEQVDPAGNRSPAVAVRDHVWTVSFSRYMPEPAVQQSHSGRFARPSWPGAAPSLLDRADDAGVQVDGQGLLVDLMRRGAISFTGASSERLAYEAATGHLLAFRPVTTPAGSARDYARWDGERWWIDAWTDSESDGDPRLYDSEVAPMVEAMELGLWVFETDGGTAWRWTGSSWKRAAPSAAAPGDPALAFDSARRAIVAFAAGADGGVVASSFNGSAWAPLTPADPENDGNPAFVPRLTATSHADGRVFLYVEPPPAAPPELWAWNGASFARLGAAFPPVTASHLVVEPGSSTPMLLGPALAPARWNGSAWQAVSVQDPERDGSPTTNAQPAPGVDLAGGLVVVTSGGLTWGWAGNSWRVLHGPWAGSNLLSGSGGRFSPLAYANPVAGQIEVCGGTGYFGPTYRDCIRWNGHRFTAVDAGIGFWPNDYGGHVAPGPDGMAGLLISGSDAGVAATWLFQDGGWVPREVGNVNLASFATWAPLAGTWYQQQNSGEQIVGRLWNGSTWVTVESAPRDAGVMPDAASYWGQQSMSWHPASGALVRFGDNSTTWVRSASGWSPLSADPEGDGNPTYGCLVAAPGPDRLFAVSADLWEFTGASWKRLLSAPAIAGEGVWPGIFGCFAAWNPWRSTFVASNYGSVFHEWDLGRDARPSLEVRVPLALGAFPATSEVSDARVRARLGGRGQVGSTPVDGATVAVWADGRWQPVGQTPASPTSPGWVDAAAIPALPASRAGLAPGGVFRASLFPSAPNGNGVARVWVDYAELTVRVRRY